MVCTTCQYPCACADLKCGLRNPQGRCNRQFGHRFGFDALYLAGNKTETVTQVNDGCLDTTAGLGCEYQAGGLLLADTYAKEMNLQLGLAGSNKRADLQHMALQA